MTLTRPGPAMLGPHWGRKNLLTNPGLNFWQRGTSFSGDTAFTYWADRWAGRRGGSDAGLEVSRIDAQTDTDIQSRFAMQLQIAAANALDGEIAFTQILPTDFSIALAGHTICFSCKVKKNAAYDANDDIIRPRIYSGEGNDEGGSPYGFSTNSTLDETTSFTLTTSWQTIFVVAVIATDKTQIKVALGGTAFPLSSHPANDYIQFADPQLEFGDAPTDFEMPNMALDFAECQRFYFKTYNAAVDPGTSTQAGMYRTQKAVTASSAVLDVSPRFPVAMHSAPTVTPYSTTGAADNVRNATDAADNAATAGDIGEMGCTLDLDSATTDEDLYQFHLTADAEL